MRVEKEIGLDAFWDWLRVHLPSTLRGEVVGAGYGYWNIIYRQDYRRKIYQKLFNSVGDSIALVYSHTITLYCPEYFSDFEDLCLKYEQEKGREITLKYWES